MRKLNFEICPEGLPIIAISALGTVVLAILGWKILAILALLFTIFSLLFFRDPTRISPSEPGIAVSPADGKIIRVARRPDPVYGQDMTCISVFMNVFNVHVNRMPVAAEIETIRYFPGLFFNASLDKASENNERCALRIKDEQGRGWTVVQIAGLIARRIVCRVNEGENLSLGERFGLIKFGSRVDLYIPDEFEPCVYLGEHVLAGQTILAREKKAA